MVSRVRRVGCATCFLNLPSVVSEVQRVSCRPLARWRRTRVDKTMLPLPCDMQPRMRPTRARETRHARARYASDPSMRPRKQARARDAHEEATLSCQPTHASAASVWRPLAYWGAHMLTDHRYRPSRCAPTHASDARTRSTPHESAHTQAIQACAHTSAHTTHTSQASDTHTMPARPSATLNAG
jgi:hypothetical protein